MMKGGIEVEDEKCLALAQGVQNLIHEGQRFSRRVCDLGVGALVVDSDAHRTLILGMNTNSY